MWSNISTLERTRLRLGYIRDRIESSNFSDRYRTIVLYNELLACSERLPSLLLAVKEHWKIVQAADGQILSAEPNLKVEIGRIQAALQSLGQSWRSCLDDIRNIS
jgi:hypothetical protein